MEPETAYPADLTARALPRVTLRASDGSDVALDALGAGRTVLYLYPMTGRPDRPLPEDWDVIPGARGCTAEACAFRDHHAELRAAGAARVYGVSAQSADDQREAAARLRLPFALLSDPELAFGSALGLPVLMAGGLLLYRRITLIVTGTAVEHVFYPVRDPAGHAAEVLSRLRACQG